MRIQLSAKFKRCCLKNKPAMPLTFSNFSRARQAHFLSYDLQIWWKVITFKGTYVIWFWFWYLSRYGIWKNVKSCTLHLTELFGLTLCLKSKWLWMWLGGVTVIFEKPVCIGLKIPKKPLVVKLVLLLSHLGASSVPFVQQFFHHLEIPLNIAKMKGNTLKFL